MKTADELRLSFIKANRGRLTMTDGQYASWLRRVVDEDRRRRVAREVTAEAFAEPFAQLAAMMAAWPVQQPSTDRPTWDTWRVPVPGPPGRGMTSDLVIVDELAAYLPVGHHPERTHGDG